MKMAIARAADVLLAGGVIAYPTEGVYGLGCMPDDPDAVIRLLAVKRRDPAKGLILIASARAQLDDWLAVDSAGLPEPEPGNPVTWIVPANPAAPTLIRGRHANLAVRLTTHPVAAALCDTVDSALVSTSANLAGRAVARTSFVLRRQFGARVDYIVPGECGPAAGPSEIRILATGDVLRPAQE
jgi:L-threonylcarbamoyladenylate synthase